jgi:hypothetical protein
LDDLLYILAFTFGFSLFDYFAYNVSAKKGWTNGLLAPYRIAQTCVQIILIAIAWAFVDILVAIGFTILWWTWVCDWIFHIFCFTDLFNDKQYVSKGNYSYYTSIELREKYYNFEKNEWECVLYWKSISWAWWTPYGLVDLLISGKDKGTKYFKIINWKVLAVQSLIGIFGTILMIIIWQSK